MEKKKENIVVSLIALIVGILALLLSWIPIVNNLSALFAIVGFILAIIAIIINRKNKKTIGVVALIISVFSFVVVMATQSYYGSKIDEAMGTSNGTIESSNTKDSSTKESNLLIDSDYKAIANNSGANDAVIDDSKSYQVSWSDNTWSGVNISIDKVDVIKVSNYNDYSSNNYQGFIVVHYKIENTTRDVNIYPEQATINTNTGLQVDGAYEMEHFAGDLLVGTNVSGNAAYPLTELDSVSDINSVRIKFSASYDTDDYNDENYHHDYDLTLNLN